MHWHSFNALPIPDGLEGCWRFNGLGLFVIILGTVWFGVFLMDQMGLGVQCSVL